MRLHVELNSGFDHGPLIEAIRQHQREYPHSKLGVGTGWAGPKELHKSPAFAALAAPFLADAITRTLPKGHEFKDICAWGNVLKAGEKIDAHDHIRSHLGGRNQLAGVYYLTAGSKFSLCVNWTQEISFAPVPGLCLVFDAGIPHCCDPATDERISLAFNVRTKSA